MHKTDSRTSGVCLRHKSTWTYNLFPLDNDQHAETAVSMELNLSGIETTPKISYLTPQPHSGPCQDIGPCKTPIVLHRQIAVNSPEAWQMGYELLLHLADSTRLTPKPPTLVSSLITPEHSRCNTYIGHQKIHSGRGHLGTGSNFTALLTTFRSPLHLTTRQNATRWKKACPSFIRIRNMIPQKVDTIMERRCTYFEPVRLDSQACKRVHSASTLYMGALLYLHTFFL